MPNPLWSVGKFGTTNEETPAKQAPALKVPAPKRIWPFKRRVTTPVCGAHSDQSSLYSSPTSTSTRSSPAPKSANPSGRIEHSCSLSSKAQPTKSPRSPSLLSFRPELPPKDIETQHQWREKKQQRRKGLSHLGQPGWAPPFSNLADDASSHRRSQSAPPQTPQDDDFSEQLILHRENVHDKTAELDSDSESLVNSSSMPLRSFAASRSSSVSSLHIPPPIRIPRPKVTLTAANGSPNPPARPQRASDAQLFVVSTASSRANRLSAPAVVTPSAYSQNSESQGNYRSPSSDNSSSLLHAEIGAAQHLSVTPAAARVLSTIMIHPSITDEIKTAMETPLPVCACSPVHSSQTGHSPSEENFPSGPLSAKSAVCFVKNRAEDAAARFDLDLLLMPDDKHPQSRVTSGSPQQRTPRADTPPPPLEDDLPEARCSSDTQSSFSSACTIQSQQSTVATSVASTSSAYSLHGPFHGTMRQRSSSAPSVDTHEVEELAAASPGLDNNRNITNPPHSPALSYEQTRVSQLSSDTLDKSMRRFILASMRTLVTEDPLLLQPESMRSIEEKLVALDSKIERLREEQASLLKAQTTTLRTSTHDPGFNEGVKTTVLDGHIALADKTSELVDALQMRSQLRLARTEHHAAAATLSLSRLNSSFMANRERLESSEKSAEQLKIQRAAAELKIRQLQHRLRAKDAEVRRLKSQNRQLVEQADTEALESRRPSDATSLREIPADPSECLFSELGRAALARPSEMPAPQQPVYDALVNPTPRSATSDSLPLSTTLSTYSFPSRLSFPMPPTSDRFERSSTIHTPNGLSRTNSLNSSLGHHGIRLKTLEDMLDGGWE